MGWTKRSAYGGESWWRPAKATARSIARHQASANYTRNSRATMGGAGATVSVDAEHVLTWMERLKMEYMGKAGVRKAIREEIVKARSAVQAEAKANIKKDPRKAVKGVQMLVYKGGAGSVEGGNVNILKPRKNESTRMVVWAYRRKNRKRTRSKKTNTIDGYYGKSRYFVLHWIDAGAKREKRGEVTATHFFTRSAGNAMRVATANVRAKIGQMIRNTR